MVMFQEIIATAADRQFDSPHLHSALGNKSHFRLQSSFNSVAQSSPSYKKVASYKWPKLFAMISSFIIILFANEQ